jgi:hypothetical protein
MCSACVLWFHSPRRSIAWPIRFFLVARRRLGTRRCGRSRTDCDEWTRAPHPGPKASVNARVRLRCRLVTPRPHRPFRGGLGTVSSVGAHAPSISSALPRFAPPARSKGVSPQRQSRTTIRLMAETTTNSSVVRCKAFAPIVIRANGRKTNEAIA